MRDDDDIAKIVNNTEVESFDIKQAWIDDMSSQLDAYNLKKSKGKYWWLLLLIIPIVSLPFFLLNDTKSNNKTNEVSNYTSKNELIENSSEIQVSERRNVLSNRKSNSIGRELENSTAFNNLKPNKKSELTEERVANIDKVESKKNRGNIVSKNTSKFNDQKVSNQLTDTKTPISLKNNGKKLNNKTSNSDNTRVSQSSTPLVDTEVLVNKNDQGQINTPSKTQAKIDEKTEGELQQLGIESQNTADPKDSETKPTKEIVENESKIDSKINPHPTDTLSITASDTTIPNNDFTNTSSPIDSNKIVQMPFEDLTIDKDKNVSVDDDEDKAKLWSIGFTLGPDFLAKELTTKENILNFKQKKEQEIFNNTLGFDFEINRYLTPWLAVGSGVGFKKYQETNSYIPIQFQTSDTTTTINTTYSFQDNSYYTFDSIQNQNDTTIWVINDSTLIIDTLTIVTNDTITNINTTTTVDSSKNIANGKVTSQYIQIPISAQFIFVDSKKLMAYTNLGLTIGLLTKNTGVVLDYSTNNIVNYTTRKMIYSANMGIGINYNLFGPLDYKLYGAYQFSLTNFSLAENVDKKYKGFSLRTGLVFHF